jgi:hypothetical protein
VADGDRLVLGRPPSVDSRQTCRQPYCAEAHGGIVGALLAASAVTTNVRRVGHAALGLGRPQRCWRSLQARSRRWAARTSGWRALALRQRR